MAKPFQSFPETARWIREQEIGRGTRIDAPFGPRLICSADLTATGRHLRVVETWVDRILPFYANTHTEISSTGRMMTRLREEARDAIRLEVHATKEDEVVFVGSGATAAVNKLVGLLGLRLPEPLERAYHFAEEIPANQHPVVFVGPYEHHSNELPWLETIAEVVEIDLDDKGRLDLEALRRALEAYADRPLRIGSFSAASNVTGVLSDVRALSRVLHRAGALAFFDYAAAAGYVPIDMHPDDPDERIDALFLSPHKFVGGPEASGVLVADRGLFRTRTPERPGGGTVSYVAGPNHEDVDYIGRLDHREEGGTPDIVGDIRAGLAFLIKRRTGPQAILEHEIDIAAKAVERLARHDGVRVLGPQGLPRLAILPIEIQGLHHNLVSELLDHLFGIQNRSGCSCAGPYGHRLLGIPMSNSGRFRALVRRGYEGIKPGWARISPPWYASEEDLDFILTAVEFVADHGMDFVPLYRFGWRDGVWSALDQGASAGLSAWSLDSLGDRFDPGQSDVPIDDERLRVERRSYLDEAKTLADGLRKRWELENPRWNPPTGDADMDELVWFRYVHADALDDLA